MTTALQHTVRLKAAPVAAACLVALGALPARAQQAAAAQVVVVSTTPLAGAELPRDRIAAPVQTADAEAMERSGALTVAEHLARRLGSVHVNELQGNPFQPDLSYRGFSASPLLGTAQGLSVYLDGVRLNQPFGDVVSWDLVPKTALASLALMPGSDPAWGLNTLGGALVLRTKDGRSHPGSAGQLSLGQSGRRQAELETGGSAASGLDWYGAASGFDERGWRDHSPSTVGQFFGTLGWQQGRTRATLTLSHARSRLNGNGLQEMELLAQRRASVYTWPDQTHQRSQLARLAVQAEPASALSLSAQLYARRIRSRTLNGDVDEDALRDEDAENLGLLTTGRSAQRQAGAGVQATLRTSLGGTTQRWLAGLAFDSSRVRFDQQAVPGRLRPDRGVDPLGASSADANGPADERGDAPASHDEDDDRGPVALDARTRTRSVYVGNSIGFSNGANLNLSARHDRVRVHNRDLVRPAPDPATLDGDHRFGRVHSAIGLVWPLGSRATAYAGANEGSRAPTAIELGCANPERPCKLPNAMAGDPPLKAVRTRTVEGGLRGRTAEGSSWRIGLFRADNRDDLLFVADDAAGFGYFRNFGRTRRQGLEFGLDTTLARGLDLSLNGTLLDATWRTAETVRGDAHSGSSGGPGQPGTINISPGQRLPLVPRAMLKAALAWRITEGWSLDLDGQAIAGSNARGNENGQHQPDGTTTLGPGRSAGYGLLHAALRWEARPGWDITARVNNLFDRRYASAAQLGVAAFNAQGQVDARPAGADANSGALRGSTFFAPGAPRQFSLSLRVAFD
jgi:outer membrane receptor protein involved in Fe transport